MLKYENEEGVEKMKTKLIKKIVVLAITTMTVIGISSIGASAAWRQDGHGWWNTKEDSYSVGWEKIGDRWFYFDQDGYMKTGWIHNGNKWYFLNSNGDMAYNVVIGGYRLGSDGAWIDDNSTGTDTTTTTGAAVVVVPTTSTTSAAVVIPTDIINDGNGYVDKYEKEKEKLDKFVDKYNKKLDQEAQKIEKKANKAWQFFYK